MLVVWVVQLITLSLPTLFEVELGCDNYLLAVYVHSIQNDIKGVTAKMSSIKILAPKMALKSSIVIVFICECQYSR